MQKKALRTKGTVQKTTATEKEIKKIINDRAKTEANGRDGCTRSAQKAFWIGFVGEANLLFTAAFRRQQNKSLRPLVAGYATGN